MDRSLEEAAGWHARMLAGDCTVEEKLAFESWLSRDESHGRAYACVATISRQLEAHGASDPYLQAIADQAYADGTRSKMRSMRGRRHVLRALAAGVVATVGVSSLLLRGSLEHDDTVHYETRPYERRDISLADGSAVQLDVDSAMTAVFSRGGRHIELLHGRAIFEVRPDASRPFVVHFGHERVTALGTVFEVSRTVREARVTLAEGSVLVATDMQAAGQGEKLVPGEQISVSAGSSPSSWERRVVDVRRVTEWSRGRLSFRDTPLADVLTEVNHYSAKKIRLDSPSLAGMLVSGSFVVGNNAAVVPALAALLPVDVVDNDNEFILYPRHGGNDE